MVMEVVHEDMGEGNMQCTNHPYKNSFSGGICAFCLQEKLGKLVSSSFPVAIFPSSSSSSSSPSFRSDFGNSNPTSGGAAASAAATHLASSSMTSHGNDCNYNGYGTRRSRLPFVLTQKKKKKKEGGGVVVVGPDPPTSIVFKRSKSTATPRRRGMHFLNGNFSDDYSPHRRGFWSFLYMSSSKHSVSSSAKKSDKNLTFTSSTPSTVCSNNVGPSSSSSVVMRSREKKREDFVIVDENGSPDQQFDRKVSRSRSVGCGSRSFSGDFFERISTGFGDCTLRRVESQREGKPKVQSSLHRGGNNNGGGGVNGQDCIKERVRCGGIFSGFMITSSSSSSSSSSYWVSSSTEEGGGGGGGGGAAKAATAAISHGRSKSWGWALASPMRAFGKPSGKRDNAKNVTPNLAAIPSLLAVSG